MVKVNWSRQAIENIFSIREYYLPISPKFADEITDQIFSKEALISAFPEAGRIVPELKNERLREVIFKNFRIIYMIFDSKNVSIVAVHTSSKPLSEISLFG
jgi:toxin ParE1/3/4